MSHIAMTDLPLSGLKLIERQRVGDHRGSLIRLFCAQDLYQVGWVKPIAQINHTCTTKRGTLRGMHFQRPPYAEMKLVSCIKGEVWDVAVDVRVGSATFLHWHAELLTAQNRRAMLIPEGFAHGFQALSDDVELLYCHSAPYVLQSEVALNAQDPQLAIPWPLEISEISLRDKNHSFISPNFEGVFL